jgi:hypothetical protein
MTFTVHTENRSFIGISVKIILHAIIICYKSLGYKLWRNPAMDFP